MSSHRRKAILWLAAFAVVYGWCIWSAANILEPVPRVILCSDGAQSVLGFTPDSSKLLTATLTRPDLHGSRSSTFPIRVWHVTDGTEHSPIKAADSQRRDDAIFQCAFASDSERIALCLNGRKLQVYDLKSNLLFDSKAQSDFWTFGFSPNGKTLAVIGDENWETWKAFDLDADITNAELPSGGDRLTYESPFFYSPPCKVEEMAVQFSACGKWIVDLVISRPSGISGLVLRDSFTDRKVRYSVDPKEVSMSPSGQSLIVRCKELQVAVDLPLVAKVEETSISFHAGSKQILYFPRLHSAGPSFVSVEHETNGKRSWSVFREWDCSGERPQEVRCIFAKNVVYSQLGRRVWATEWDPDSGTKTVALTYLDLETKVTATIGTLNVSRDFQIRMEPYGRRSAISWEKYQGPVRDPFAAFKPLLNQLSRLMRKDLSATLLGIDRPRLEVWDGPAQKCLCSLRGHFLLGFAPDGETFATQDESYGIYLWDANPRRNWPLAAGLAIVLEMIATIMLIGLVTLGRRIAGRFRRAVVLG